MFTNREIALAVWLGAALLWAVAQPRLRRQLRSIAAAATTPTILVPLGVFALGVTASAWLASQVVDWSLAQTKGTVVWFLTAGVVLFASFEKAVNADGFFRRTALGLFAWTAFVEFYLDLFHLPLLAEVALQPFLFVLTAVAVVAVCKPETRSVATCAELVLALAGLALLGYVVMETVRGWGVFDARGLVVQFALPAWYTFVSLPFVFLLGAYAAYEHANRRLRVLEGATRWQALRTMLALVLGFRWAVRDMQGFSAYRIREISQAPSMSAALQIVSAHRVEFNKRRDREGLEAARLLEFAGVEGVDEHGQQLDRREFAATKEALRWLGTCMSGWYGKKGRYPSDLFERLVDSFDRFDLDPSSIHVEISEDGQSWYAWRKTVGGWCFALGADAQPPDQWEYDGQERPVGFPGQDPSWGDRPHAAGSVNTNWLSAP